MQQLKRNLLCTFYHKTSEELVLDFIWKTYQIPGSIYVYDNQNLRDGRFCTYNITDRDPEVMKNTIVVHRKSVTNTLYTINAVNAIIAKLNNGILVNNFPIDWEIYRDTFLINDTERIPLKLLFISK